MQILNLNESKMNNKKSNNDLLQTSGVKQNQYIIYNRCYIYIQKIYVTYIMC